MRAPLKRGVYRSPFLTPSGDRVLVAVDECGREVASAIVPHDRTENEITRELKRELCRIDPLVITINARGPKGAIAKLIQRSQEAL